MEKYQVFNSPQFGELRAVQDSGGVPLFIARDVSMALFGHSSSRDVQKYCRHAVFVDIPDYKCRSVLAIGLSDVSRLILKCNEEYAIDFHDWIFEEVFPMMTGTSFFSYKVKKSRRRPVRTDVEQKRNLHYKNDSSDVIESILKTNASNEKRIEALELQMANMGRAASTNHNTDYDYITIAGFVRRFNLPINAKEFPVYGTMASGICKKRNVKISKIPDVSYGFINQYPYFILKEVFNKYIE